MQHKLRTTLAVVLLCGLAATAQTAANTKEKSAAIDRLFTAYNATGDFNGSALVAYEGKVIFEKGYGSK
jgi:hypothetical protein